MAWTGDWAGGLNTVVLEELASGSERDRFGELVIAVTVPPEMPLASVVVNVFAVSNEIFRTTLCPVSVM